jgi:cold shock CspA family protein
MTGIIQSYFDTRGFGFVLVNFRDRRFFHVIDYHGAVPPTPGMRVEFDLAPSKKKGFPDQAVRVVPSETSVGGAR